MQEELALNRLIARRIFDIQPTTKCPCCVDGYYGTEQDYYFCKRCQGTGKVDEFIPARQYTKDDYYVADIMRKVVDKTGNINFQVRGPMSERVYHVFIMDPYEGSIESSAKTLPMALCLCVKQWLEFEDAQHAKK